MKDTTETKTKLVKALTELHDLEKAHEDAKQKESFARLRTTEALNALNKKQREIDDMLTEIRSNSGGDWARKGREVYVDA